jgi:antitoxin component YwqK of YwqJK toxin-antitoxin module
MKGHIITLVVISLFSSLAFGQPGKDMPQGIVGKDFNVTDAKGKRQGLWVQQWKTTKSLLYKGEYKDGLPVGEWQRFYSDGKLMAITKHIQDTVLMDVTFFHPDGKTKMTEGSYRHKLKEGNWKLWDIKGTLLSDENYKDSLLHGNCKYYSPNSNLLKDENYVKGIKEGAFTEYFDNGKMMKQGTYVKGRLHGDYKSWYASGAVDCTGKYYNGVPDGDWYCNDFDGSPKVAIRYNKGKEVKRKYQNGTFKEYYENGEIPKSEYTYDRGMKNGPFTEWYNKGYYEQVPASAEDKKIGIVLKERLAGTQIKVKGEYLNDKLDGEIFYYRENGVLDKVEEWSNGELVRTRQGMR